MSWLSEYRKRKRLAIETGAHTTAISIFAVEQGKEDPSCWEEDGVIKTLPCLPMVMHTVLSKGTTPQQRLNDVIKHINKSMTVITNENGEVFRLDEKECKTLEKLWKQKLEVLRNQPATLA